VTECAASEFCCLTVRTTQKDELAVLPSMLLARADEVIE
jgi:hypothetical protein